MGFDEKSLIADDSLEEVLSAPVQALHIRADKTPEKVFEWAKNLLATFGSRVSVMSLVGLYMVVYMLEVLSAPVQALHIRADKTPEKAFEWAKELQARIGSPISILSLVGLGFFIYMLGAMVSRGFLPSKRAIGAKPSNFMPPTVPLVLPSLQTTYVEPLKPQPSWPHRQASVASLLQAISNKMSSLDSKLTELRSILRFLEEAYVNDSSSPLVSFCQSYYFDLKSKHYLHTLVDQTRNDVISMEQSVKIVLAAYCRGGLRMDFCQLDPNIHIILFECMAKIREGQKVCQRFGDILGMATTFKEFVEQHLNQLAEVIDHSIAILQPFFSSHYIG